MSKDIHHHITPPPFAPIPPYDGHPHPFPHRHEAPRNHSARFRPMMLHPHIPHHFNFWCNKVIPLAYDDSLSYYEVLAKVADYLNNMLNDEKMMMINVEELAQAFCELQGFVNDYFAFYQSKGIINFEAAITNDNYLEILPDADNAQMNTVYRMQFVEGSTQNVPANLPESAKPYNHEAVLFNLSNFVVKRVGNEWLEVTDDNKEYSTKGNYQLFITGKDIYFRENNSDTWGEWNSIFGNWWEEKFEDVKEYVAALLDDLWAAIRAEVARATAAEQALDTKIEAETTRATAAEQAETDRATAAENALSQRLVAEYERAAAKESELEQAIEDETDRAEQVEGNLQTAIQTETTRATNAEGAIRTDLNAEITRATARENEISADIADVARDLSEEIVDRQQADENLQDSIDSVASDLADEVTRATTEEQSLDGKISTERSRAEGAESAIRASYIPNGGNSLSNMTLDLTRSDFRFIGASGAWYAQSNGFTFSPPSGAPYIYAASNLTPSAPAVDIENGYTTVCSGNTKITTNNNTGKAYYLNPNNLLTVDGREIAVKADFDGYIPNAGNTVNGSFGLSRQSMNFTATLTGVQFTTPMFLIRDNSNTRLSVESDRVQIFAGNLSSAHIVVGDNLSPFGAGSINLSPASTGQAFYFKSGTSLTVKREIATIEDVENATSGSASQSWVNQQLQGYIPNAGNTQSVNFTLIRDVTKMQTNLGNSEITIDGDGVNIKSDSSQTYLSVGFTDSDNIVINAGEDILLKHQSDNRIHAGTDGVKLISSNSNTYIDLGITHEVDDVEIHAEDGAVKFVTDSVMLQAADNDVTIGGDTDIKIYAGDTHDVILQSTFETAIYAPTYSNIKALKFESELETSWFDRSATLNIHGNSINEWDSFGNDILSNNGSVTKFVFDIANKTIGIAANTDIGNDMNGYDYENVVRFINCTFNITNGNAIITINGGRAEFENCRFVAPSYVNNKVMVTDNAYATFKNCTFENVDVYCVQGDPLAIFTMENCYCSHGLYLEPTTNPDKPIKIFSCYFDTESMTVPTGQTTINALVAGCRFATGTSLTEIRHHWNNTNVGD